eukprot:6207850-Pleurochrysis_carterae.AAC.4
MKRTIQPCSAGETCEMRLRVAQPLANTLAEAHELTDRRQFRRYAPTDEPAHARAQAARTSSTRKRTTSSSPSDAAT